MVVVFVGNLCSDSERVHGNAGSIRKSSSDVCETNSSRTARVDLIEAIVSSAVGSDGWIGLASASHSGGAVLADVAGSRVSAGNSDSRGASFASVLCAVEAAIAEWALGAASISSDCHST